MSTATPRVFPLGTVLNYNGAPIVSRQLFPRTAGGPWSKKTTSGSIVDEDSVLEESTILACVRVLAESIASLPCELYNYDETTDELTEDDTNPMYNMVRWQWNPEVTAYEGRFETIVDAIMRGYGAAQIIRTAKGRPLELWPLQAKYLLAVRAPDDQRLLFTYQQYDPKNQRLSPRLLEAEEVLLIKAFPHGGGLLGSSITRLGAEEIGAAQGAQSYSAEFFENGSINSGTLEVQEELSEEAYQRLKKDWKELHTGKGNRHKTAILEGGTKFTALSLTNQESQMLETQKYKRSTLAGMLRIPAHLINDLEKGTFSNIEQLDLGFVKHTLRPWLTNIEQRLRMSLLNSGEQRTKEFCHDLVDLLRGDFPSRMEGYSKAVTAGVLSPNDVRRKERWNPYKGGDTYFVQGALRPTDVPYQSSGGVTPTASPQAKAFTDAERLLITKLLS